MSERTYWFWMRPPNFHLSAIVSEVAERHGLSVEDILGPSRRRPISHARQEAMWELRHRTSLSYPQISKRLGRSDHTASWHGCRAHEARKAGAAAAQ